MVAYLNADGDNVFAPSFIADGVDAGLRQYDVIVVQNPLQKSTGIHAAVALDKAAGWAFVGW